MPVLATHQPGELPGVAEADETFFRMSYKGLKKGMPRKSHKRGSPAGKRGISTEQVAVQVPRGSHKLVPYHIQNVNALHSRIKGWMRPFRGVATKNLPAYLAWFRFFDQALGVVKLRRLVLDALRRSSHQHDLVAEPMKTARTRRAVSVNQGCFRQTSAAGTR